MAHSLGLNVVAEGVETEAQVLFLREHGCDEIQGYWLSPPLDAHRCLGLHPHAGRRRSRTRAVHPVTRRAPTRALTAARTLPNLPLMDTRRHPRPAASRWPRASTSCRRSRSG